MDKKELKSVFSGLSQNQQIVINFRSNVTDFTSGTYKVLNTKKGKGKGGSIIVEMQALEGGESIVIGTPQSDKILNITVGGRFAGFENEEDVPLVFVADVSRANSLKTTAKSLNVGDRVRVASSVLEELNGEFSVTGVKASKGRGAQVVVSLKNESGNTVELWTYRYSSVIDLFEVVQ